MAGTTVKDVNPHVFVKAYAAYLKKTGKLDVPKWVDLVKTATFKELAPYDQDWYYIRAGKCLEKIIFKLVNLKIIIKFKGLNNNCY